MEVNVWLCRCDASCRVPQRKLTCTQAHTNTDTHVFLFLSFTMTGRWGDERTLTLSLTSTTRAQLLRCVWLRLQTGTVHWTYTAGCVRRKWRKFLKLSKKIYKNRKYNMVAQMRKTSCRSLVPFRQSERERPEGIFKQPCGSSMLLSVSETETLLAAGLCWPTCDSLLH